MSANNTQLQVGSFYTVGEEIANIITHGIGAALSVAMLTVLVVFASQDGDIWRIVSVSIFGASMTITYLASTIYHAVTPAETKRLMRRFDHAAIYLLIAGTYTPFLLVNLRDSIGWYFFAVIWGLAALGVTYKLLFTGLFDWIAVVAYVVMGWMCVLMLRPMLASVSSVGMKWLVVGGLCYTLGVVFYAWRKLPYNHAIWHCFTVAGTVFHFFSILYSVVLV